MSAPRQQYQRKLSGGGCLPCPWSGMFDLLAARNDRRAELRTGPDVSWLARCRVGDDQGHEGACVIFALANWVEIVQAVSISDDACIAMYHAALAAAGRPPGSGLTFPEGFEQVQRAGWIGRDRVLDPVDDLTDLSDQPVLVAVEATAALDNVSPEGCLDHSASLISRGGHAMVAVAHGALDRAPDQFWVWLEQSWGLAWGWRGICVASEDLFRALCRELWVIRRRVA